MRDTRDGHVHIPADRGVEVIGPELDVSTAEGVTVGTKVANVKEIYPDLDQAVVEQLGRNNVHVPGNPTAVHRFGFRNSEVESISLH